MEVISKADGALKTISEVSIAFGIPQHILRYWETRFPQLRPLTRAGNRRYYRPGDVALVARIDSLLNREGYTIKGVQKLLATRSVPAAPVLPAPLVLKLAPVIAEIRRVRASLVAALEADAR